MTQNQEFFRAVFEAVGIDQMIADFGKVELSFSEIYDRLKRLQSVPEIDIKLDKALSSSIQATQAIEALAAAYDTSVRDIIARDKELQQIQKESGGGAANFAAEEKLRRLREEAERIVARTKADAQQAINDLNLSRERAGTAIGLGAQARAQGSGYIAPPQTLVTGNAQADKFLSQSEDAQRQYLNAIQARNEAIEKGLTSESQLANINEQVTRAARRRDELLNKAVAVLQGEEDANLKARSDQAAQDSKREADREAARLAKQEAELRRQRVKDLEAAFGVKPGSALFSQENALSQEEINKLLAPRVDFTGARGLDKALVRQAELAQQQVALDEQIVKAKEDARAGLVSRATSDKALAELGLQQENLEQQILRNDELIRIATQNQASAAERSSLSALQRAQADFLIGFRGVQDNSYAQQIGQAFKFSVFYGTAYKLLFAFTQTLQATLQEGIQFQQGMTDLAIATGRPKDELRDLGERLATIASDTGASPQQGPQIAARAIGIFGATQAPLQEQERIAEITTKVVSRLAVGSGKQPIDLLGSVGAIAQALGLGVNGTYRIADLDAYFTKRFGAQQGSTLDAVAQSATIGKAAGFSDEELFALAASIIGKTGQTPSAVGGYLAQLFSRGGQGALNTVEGRLGIDQTAPLADQLRALADAYKTASPIEQSTIAASLGRGKSQNALVAGFLASFDDIKASVKDSGKGAPGAADEQFNERMKDIGGRIAQLSGQFKEMAHLLGESGLLDALGAGVIVLTDFLKAVNIVLSAFNELPRSIKDTIVGLALLNVALRVFTGAGIAGNLAAGAGTLYGAAAGQGVAGGAAGGAAARAASLATIASYVIGIGALVAVYETLKKEKAALDANAAFYNDPNIAGTFSSGGQLQSQADALDALAKQNRDAIGGGLRGKFIQGITFGHANDGYDATAAAQAKEADRLRAVAQALAARDLANKDASSTFSTFDKEGIDAGLSAIAANGGSAAVQLRALTEAINGLGKTAANTRDKIVPGDLATGIADNAFKGIIGRKYDGQRGQDIAKTLREGRLSGTNIQEQLAKQLDQYGITNYSQLTPGTPGGGLEVAEKISKNIAAYGVKGLDLDPKAKKAVQDALANQIELQLIKAQQTFEDALHGTGGITAAAATGAAQDFVATSDARTNERSQTDYTGRVKDAVAKIKGLRNLRSRVNDGGDISAINVLIRQAREDVAKTEIDRLEALRKVAENNAKDEKAAAKAADPLIRQEINAAVKNRSADQLARVLAGAGPLYRAVAKKAIKEAQAIADAKYLADVYASEAYKALQAEMDAAYQAALAGPGDPNPQDVVPGTILVPKPPSIFPKDDKGNTSLDYSPSASSGSGGSTADQPTAEEIAAARKAAEAARRGGQVGPARAALAQAKAELDKAKKGTLEYYNALASYYQAQDSLSDAIRNYAHIRAELRIDTTDPLAEARLALQVARNKLASDIKKGKAPDQIAQDRLDLKNAKNAAEATAFDQRLQDVQTAEELGRITHGAYLNYLQSEHNRLQSIAHKTRQQQDELNQIDRLLKEANDSLQGQFNIGDIKLPTPYEVRRYIQTQATAGGIGAAAAAGGTTTIYIDGADTAKVKAIIDDTVGKSSRVLTTTTRRN